ncbi:MAG: M60 family metallopeptidase [Limnochordia bacterium]|jgi:hypothetical protein|nr:M60 family metallopeptidase [Limnochordia bacterium]
MPVPFSGIWDQAFAHFNNPNRDYNVIDDFYHNLVMFWQLDLAFGEDFYPALHRAYREVPQSEQPATDQEKIQQFIVTASEVANYNLTPFFEMWGLHPTRQIKEQISHLPQLTQPIWWLTDDGLKLPPVSLRLGNGTERLDLLTGTPLTDVTTVCIDDPDIKLEKVTVLIDGEELDQNGSIPALVTLRPTELTQGNHNIRVIADDSQGRRYTSTVHFLIEHFDLVAPIRTGRGAERLRGRVTIAVDPIIPAKDIVNVTAKLRPVSSEPNGTDTASSGEYILFDATFLPVRFPINTLVFPDGPYDLVISAETIDGVVSEVEERVLLDNFEFVEDQILPPQNLAWFGIRNALKTVQEPEGWAYAGGDPDIFFGDQDRIRREGTGAQHLTWHVPNIYRYALTIYAQNSRIKDDVLVQVSSDGELWTTLDYAIDVTHPEDNEQPLWLKLDLTGTVPRALPAELLRVVFRDGEIPKEALQLGYVYLEGVKDQAILDFFVTEHLKSGTEESSVSFLLISEGEATQKNDVA